MRGNHQRLWRTITVLAIGIAIGTALAASPASGHITGSVSHVAKHMKNFFYTKSQSEKRYVNVGESGAFIDVGLTGAFPTCEPPGNNWQNISPNVNNSVSYRRDPLGTVSVRGIALRCGTATNPVFTLPAGYRPARQEIHVVMHSSGIARRVNIDSGGAVNIDVLPADGEWVSLDGITFRCAPSGANGCP